jgi:hypothetical protein
VASREVPEVFDEVEQTIPVLREGRGVPDAIVDAEPDDTHRNDRSESSRSTRSRSERIAWNSRSSMAARSCSGKSDFHPAGMIPRGDGRSITEFAEENGIGSLYVSRILRLGFLAPDVTTAILEGCEPIEFSPKRLSVTADLPMDRREQRRELGFG